MKQSVMIREAPQETPDWTVDEQLSLFFANVPEGIQPIVMLKPGEERFIPAIRRHSATAVIEVGKTVGELVRDKHLYLRP